MKKYHSLLFSCFHGVVENLAEVSVFSIIIVPIQREWLAGKCQQKIRRETVLKVNQKDKCLETFLLTEFLVIGKEILI